MNAIVYTRYGPPEVLHLAEVETPRPKEHDVLVRVHASSVGYGDMIAREMGALSVKKFNMPLPLLLPTKLFFGWNRPRITVLGSEFAGEVSAVGTSVTRFKPGDAVYGYRGMAMGCYAEYLCMPEEGSIATMPARLSFEEAATLPYGAIMASSLLKKTGIQPGHRVLINGASGGIGSMAVQLAIHAGARVTGVCGTSRMDFVRFLGAEEVIDYSREDFTRTGRTWDVIFDVLGTCSFSRCRHSLTPEGTLFHVSFKARHLLQMLRTVHGSGQKVVCAMAREEPEDLERVRDLCNSGKTTTRVDRAFAPHQAAMAHHYIESGERKGKVVISWRLPSANTSNQEADS